METQSTEDQGEQRGRVKLTPEELKVLQECRIQSVYFRGVPAAIISGVCVKYATKLGWIHAKSKLFYAGICGLSFISGVSSYADQCRRKILALENSVLADQYRGVERRQQETFRNASPEFDSKRISPDTDRVHNENEPEMKSRWDEIRDASRKQTRSGSSFEDIRKRNEKVSMPTTASSYSSDFSRDDESRSHVFSLDNNGNTAGKKPPEYTKRSSGKTYTQATGRKNEYGDEME